MRTALAASWLVLALGATGCSEPGSPGSATPAPGGAADAVITMQGDMTFDPPLVRVRAGAVVEWVNASELPHTATARSGNAPSEQIPEGVPPWDSGLLQPGERFRLRLDVPGPYRYVCTLHLASGMAGRIEVVAGSDAG